MFLSKMARRLPVVAVLRSGPQFLLCLGPSCVCQMHILSASWIKVPFFPIVDRNHLMSDLRQNLIGREVAAKGSRCCRCQGRHSLGLRDLAAGPEAVLLPRPQVVAQTVGA